MTSTGGTDVFVAKFNRSGEYLWSRSFGDADYQYGMSIAASDEGNVLIAGKFSGTIDLGGGPLTSTDGGDIFLAKLRTP